jgi:hypothetical protein
MFSLVLSIIALILAVLAIGFVVVIKVYYIDKLMDATNSKIVKIDKYEKYRNNDGLFSKKAGEKL